MAHEEKQIFTMKQILAIKMAREYGSRIAQEHPGIADGYRAGRTHDDIVEEHGIMGKYDLSEGIAARAVGYALRELIPKDELKGLMSEHHSVNGQKNYEESRGMFSLTEDEMAEAGRKGGKKSYERGSGMFSLTEEQLAGHRKKAGRKGGKKSALSRGHTPWSDEEAEYFVSLCQNPLFRHSGGRYDGQSDYKAIRKELISKFGTKRTVNGLGCMRERLKGSFGEAG